MSGFEDFEGLGQSQSIEGITNEGLTEAQKDYINELVPDSQTWQNMSLTERVDSVYELQGRIEEIQDLSGKSTEAIAESLSSQCVEQIIEAGRIEDFGCVECVENGIQVTSDFLNSGKAVEYSLADIEDRKEMAYEFFEDVKGALGIESKLYIEEMEPNACGYQTEGEIHLNSTLLENPNPAEVLKTILHESRHALQGDSINDISEMQICPDVVSDWAANQGNYIDPDWDFEGYQNQPLEKDAFEFENYVFSEALNNYSQNQNSTAYA